MEAWRRGGVALLIAVGSAKVGKHLVWDDVIGDCLARPGHYGWRRVRHINWGEGRILLYEMGGSEKSEWFCHSIEREKSVWL